jgi:NTE family protein
MDVALVLASGGARGLAHIGVIEELEKNGFNITSIAGSSIGSVIGGLYACGKLKEFKNWICNLDQFDVMELMDFTMTLQGFIKGENFFKELDKFFGTTNIEDLKIPLCIVATNIDTRKEVVFESGSLSKAIRASVAIPTVIVPVKYKGQYLIDGGVISPIPVESVKRKENDILVVVDINANIPYEKPDFEPFIKKQPKRGLKRDILKEIKKFIEIFNSNKEEKKKTPSYLFIVDKSIDIMQDKICSLIKDHYKPDIMVDISRECSSTFEFDRAQELIETGRTAFLKGLKKSNLNNK